MKPVTDPALLAELDGPAAAGGMKPVTDPALLSQLDGGSQAGTGTPGAELRNYEPTMREKIAQFFMGGENEDTAPTRAAIVGGLLGSTGLPGSEQISAVDFTPARIPLLAQEAARDFEEGDNLGGTLNAIGALPIPLMDKAIGAVASKGAKVADKLKTAEAAERLGVSLPRGVDSRTAGALKEVPVPDVVGNPLVTSADQALRDVAAAGQNISRNRVSPEKGAASIADWMKSATDDVADDAARAAPQADDASRAVAQADMPVDAPDIPDIPDAPPAPNLGPQQPVTRVVTPDQSMEVAARPQLVELADLKRASGDLQPRDRGRAEYTTEVLERAARLDPEQLRPGRVSDSGAPIVLPDGTIVSGNGRALSIARVYSDPALAEKAAAYRASLGPEAANMKNPVLVMRTDDMTPEAAAKFADLSNRGRIAALGATERAARDAKALGADGVALYRGGDFDAPQNADFMRYFIEKVATPAERNALSKDGRLTMEGMARMRGSILASAYDDAPTLSKMLESTDDNIRNLTGALTDAAPKMAALKADIKAGVVLPEMDATPQIAAAVRKINDLRNQGTTADRWFAQLDAFDDTDPLVKEWVRAFHTDDLARPQSRQKMAEVLDAYAEEARKHAPGGLFDDPTTAGDVLNVARRSGDEGVRGAPAAGADVLESGAQGNGARNAEGGLQAGRSAARESGGGTVQSGRQAGDGIPGQAGNGREGQTRDGLSLENALPPPKSAQEVLLDANKKRLGDALGMSGDFRPSMALNRIEELARSGSAADTASLLKAKALLGDEAWTNVSSGILAKMGAGRANDIEKFSEAWKALPENGKKALFGGNEMASTLDDFVTVFEKVPRLHKMANPLVKRAQQRLIDEVPIVGPILANRLGNAAVHATTGALSGGIGTGASSTAIVVGKFLSRPSSVKSLTRWAKAYSALQENGKNAATALSIASRVLARELANETGEDEAKIARALESIGEAR